MRTRPFAVFIVLSLLAVGAVLAAESYTVDPEHSHIGFSVRHFAVSSVRGEFKDFSATLLIDEKNPTASSVELRIKTNSIFTDHEQRDAHLKSADFLDVENHPELVFKSTKLEKKGEDFLATGNLTLHGVTREIQMEINLAGPLLDPLKMMRIGIEGDVTIDRHDYGVSWSRVMDNGGLFVGNDVKISFSLEATRQVEEAAGGGR